MNLALAATTFAVVFPAELPDKTFIASVVMSSRHRPLAVWVGAAAGLILQAGVAAVAGRLLALLPHHVVEGVVTALFFAGAAYLLFVPERSAEREADELAERGGSGVLRHGPSFLRVSATAFGVVALAEFGDLTQVIIANLTARSGDALSVFVGASVAFLIVSGLGVLVGRTIIRYVPLILVRRISGLILLGFGIYELVQAVSG